MTDLLICEFLFSICVNCLYIGLDGIYDFKNTHHARS